MDGPFSCFLDDDFEIYEYDEWVLRVLVIVTNLFRNRQEKWDF